MKSRMRTMLKNSCVPEPDMQYMSCIFTPETQIYARKYVNTVCKYLFGIVEVYENLRG